MTGTGTQEDPYIIMNVDDLYGMKQTGGKTKYFKLGADISLNGTPYAEHFVPIPFNCAQFDGDGHKIRDIYHSNPTGSVAVFSDASATTSTQSFTVKNLIVENTELVGNNFYFFTGTSASTGSYILYNCIFSMKFTATSIIANSSSGSNCLLHDEDRRIKAELCTFVIDVSLYQAYPVFFNDNLKRCQMRLEMTLRNNLAETNKRSALMKSTTINDSYFFGSIIQTGGTEESNVYLLAQDGSHSNFYTVFSYSRIANVYWNSILTTTCFYDSDIAGNTQISNTNASGNPNNLYGLTTAQCKNAEYLRSIGFICEGE